MSRFRKSNSKIAVALLSIMFCNNGGISATGKFKKSSDNILQTSGLNLGKSSKSSQNGAIGAVVGGGLLVASVAMLAFFGVKSLRKEDVDDDFVAADDRSEINDKNTRKIKEAISSVCSNQQTVNGAVNCYNIIKTRFINAENSISDDNENDLLEIFEDKKEIPGVKFGAKGKQFGFRITTENKFYDIISNLDNFQINVSNSEDPSKNIKLFSGNLKN